MKTSKFYYRKGSCETRIPWFKPDPHYMNKWKDEFFKIPNVEKFRYFMHGGTAYGSKDTWDIDIAVCGESSNLEIIENILYRGIQLGLNNRQLIDLHHIEIPAEVYSYPTPCNHFEVACHTFRETGTCTFEECYETQPKRKWQQMIYYGIERVKNDQSMKLYPEGTDYIKGELYISPDSGFGGNEKIINKMKSRVYTSAPIEITTSTDFRRHIIWPE